MFAPSNLIFTIKIYKADYLRAAASEVLLCCCLNKVQIMHNSSVFFTNYEHYIFLLGFPSLASDLENIRESLTNVFPLKQKMGQTLFTL